MSEQYKLIKKILDDVCVCFREQLSDVNKNILCEVLKALFNITLELSNVSSEKLISDFSELVLQLQFMLTRYNSEECDDVVTHICHLLVNLPKEALQMLCSEVNKKKHGAKDVAVAAEVETTEKFGHQLVFQVFWIFMFNLFKISKVAVNVV